MRSSRLAIVTCAIVGMAFSSCGTPQKSSVPETRLAGEEAPAFRVSDLLPETTYRGENYRVADKVPVVDCQYSYTIESDFGDIPAMSTDLLLLRLRELRAIETARRITDDTHFVDGIVKSLRQTERGVGILLQEPITSIARTRKGLGRMVGRYLDPSDRRAGSLERRELALRLNCDPETTNPVLRALLDQMSVRFGAGSLSTGLAMSLVPGLNNLPMTAEIKDTVAKSPPHTINQRIEEQLTAAGTESYLSGRFCRNMAFTTFQRLHLMRHFRKLAGVQNRSALIEAAAEAETQEAALGVIHIGRMLEDLHQKRSIVSLDFRKVPEAILPDGTRVVLSSEDYIHNTEEVREGVAAYRAKHSAVPVIFGTAGRLSPSARRTLESADIQVFENGQFGW